jgi:hypothetical protein
MWQPRPYAVDIGVFSDFGEFLYQITYLQNHGNPDATFTYGLSIVSLDYTPNPVPEASTVALLGAGLLHLVRRRGMTRVRA